MNFTKIIFPLIFAFAGTLFLFIAYNEAKGKYKIIQEGIDTEGMVIDIYQKPRRIGEAYSTAQAPVVQFFTNENKRIKYYSTTFLTPCPYQIGNPIKVKYLVSNPQAVILDWKDAWILSIAFGVFGGLISLISYYFLIKGLFNLFILYQKGNSIFSIKSLI